MVTFDVVITAAALVALLLALGVAVTKVRRLIRRERAREVAAAEAFLAQTRTTTQAATVETELPPMRHAPAVPAARRGTRRAAPVSAPSDHAAWPDWDANHPVGDARLSLERAHDCLTAEAVSAVGVGRQVDAAVAAITEALAALNDRERRSAP